MSSDASQFFGGMTMLMLSGVVIAYGIKLFLFLCNYVANNKVRAFYIVLGFFALSWLYSIGFIGGLIDVIRGNIVVVFFLCLIPIGFKVLKILAIFSKNKISEGIEQLKKEELEREQIKKEQSELVAFRRNKNIAKTDIESNIELLRRKKEEMENEIEEQQRRLKKNRTEQMAKDKLDYFGFSRFRVVFPDSFVVLLCRVGSSRWVTPHLLEWFLNGVLSRFMSNGNVFAKWLKTKH